MLEGRPVHPSPGGSVLPGLAAIPRGRASLRGGRMVSGAGGVGGRSRQRGDAQAGGRSRDAVPAGSSGTAAPGSAPGPAQTPLRDLVLRVAAPSGLRLPRWGRNCRLEGEGGRDVREGEGRGQRAGLRGVSEGSLGARWTRAGEAPAGSLLPNWLVAWLPVLQPGGLMGAQKEGECQRAINAEGVSAFCREALETANRRVFSYVLPN